ncbi:SMP-30/gluconolactonase/LRE family protein [Actinokineospora enzanensis]|uniref:SMP-30/gluconolactonase/LRE family protein n=1 Tax=Actinokineospora enzanensis TaxID=155975 RepID=UPI0003806932|nr:hypothetical protein [Actinokineospora enzanensis]
MTRRIAVLVTALVAVTGLTSFSANAAPDTAGAASTMGFPGELKLPDGFRPEGIAIGRAPVAYFGSLADGRIQQVDLRTGKGAQLSPAVGGPSIGMKVDPARNRLYVAGGSELRAIDLRDGKVLGRWPVPGPGAFVNDVVVARDGVYFSDSYKPTLYKLAIGRDGSLPKDAQAIALSGEWEQVPNSFNGNGILTTPDEQALVLGNSSTGKLYRVDPATGAAKVVDLGGTTIPGNDGELRVGRDVYIMENGRNTIAKVELSQDGTKGSLQRRLFDAHFDIATAVAVFGDSLYAVNARFSTPPTPTTPYTAVAVPRF